MRARLATGALALCLSWLPFTLTLHSSGFVSVELSGAFAKSNGSSGSGSGNGSGSSGSGSGSGHSGSGHGGGSGGSGPGDGSSGHLGPNGERVEIRGSSIEVIYPDGWKEEVKNGRYELHDPAGRTVIERAATSEDLIRMRALAP